MSFARRDTGRWRRDVPGARWFKADLHIHTIDDLPGGRAKLPSGVNGSPESEETLTSYVRRFLQYAVERGVRVLGITPHSPRMGSGAGASAVWRIVEEWNSGDDGNELQLSNKTAEEAFRDLRAFHDRESSTSKDGGRQWDYLTLAPHIETAKGLLSAQEGQVLQYLEDAELAGLALGDERLPEDILEERSWLADGMTRHRQAFFHGSGAYFVSNIGRRHTWLKLANPRIEALRQAFIASDSRIRTAYERGTVPAGIRPSRRASGGPRCSIPRVNCSGWLRNPRR